MLCGAVRAHPQCETEAERSHYTLEQVTFEGASTFPSEQLRSLIPIASGDLFSVSKVRSGLRAITELYGEHGYINFTVTPESKCNKHRRSIGLALTLDEGPQFRVAKVLILAPKAIAELLYSAWPVKPGAIYDQKIVHEFFLQNRAVLPVGWNPAENFVVNLDEKSKSVELRINVCPANEVCPQATTEF